MTLSVDMHVRRSLTLIDHSGPEILFVFWMKGQVLHHEGVHLKVPGSLLDFSVPLTKKLPMFLSSLKDIQVVEVKVFGWS